MSTNYGAKVPYCDYCKRPILGQPVIIAGAQFHYECTQSPYVKPQQQIIEPMLFGPLPKSKETYKFPDDVVRKLIETVKDNP